MAVNTTLVQFGEDVVGASSSVVDIVSNVLALFTQPPLSFFVAIVVVGGAYKMIRGFIHR